MNRQTFTIYGDASINGEAYTKVDFDSDSDDAAEIISIIESSTKAYLYISHLADDESHFLPIKKQWSADSKVITNEYHYLDEEGFEDSGKYMLDCVVSITHSKSGQKRAKQLIQMIVDNQVVEDSFMTSDGRSFKSRQGRYRYCRRTGATYA